MLTLSRLVERMALAVLLLGGVGMLAAMFLGTADVVGTQFLGWPIPGAVELTESTMVLIVFGALAFVQIRRGHIRVELVYSHMGPRVRSAMDALADLAAMVFFGLLLWQAIGEAMLSLRIREATLGLIRFPLYPARWTIVVGTGLLIVQLGLDLFHDVQRMRGREPIETREVAPAIPEIPAPEDNEDNND
jgi:TRAP-type C4-dicarboxylate transport system permease small subunit